MRQVFTSTRLENVERVEQLLNEAGIATKITEGRSWKGNSRREFSYTARNQDASPQPAVWVLRPDDFKQAREILHAAGLLASTRDASYLPDPLKFRDAAPTDPARRISRIRIALIAGVAIAAGWMLLRMFVI